MILQNMNRPKLLNNILPESIFVYKKTNIGKTVYLSFDDGPHPTVTPELLDLLKKYNIKATFFCIGEKVEKYPEIVIRIYNQGHRIGNHSFHHRRFGSLTFKDQVEEYKKADYLLQNIAVQRRKLFRPPQGSWSIPLLIKLMLMGVTCVHWSYDSYDSMLSSPDAVVQRFLKTPIKSGDVILFHDDDRLALLALDMLIPFWKRNGFNFACL